MDLGRKGFIAAMMEYGAPFALWQGTYVKLLFVPNTQQTLPMSVIALQHVVQYPVIKKRNNVTSLCSSFCLGVEACVGMYW